MTESELHRDLYGDWKTHIKADPEAPVDLEINMWPFEDSRDGEVRLNIEMDVRSAESLLHELRGHHKHLTRLGVPMEYAVEQLGKLLGYAVEWLKTQEKET